MAAKYSALTQKCPWTTTGIPRVYLFLREEEQELTAPIKELLSHELPHEFLGISVDTVPAPDEPGTRWMQNKSEWTGGPHGHPYYTARFRAGQHELGISPNL